MLPLTFANPADYDKIAPEGDRISLLGLAQVFHLFHARKIKIRREKW